MNVTKLFSPDVRFFIKNAQNSDPAAELRALPRTLPELRDGERRGRGGEGRRKEERKGRGKGEGWRGEEREKERESGKGPRGWGVGVQSPIPTGGYTPWH